MIKLHEFNTEWWGSPVGIVTDSAFFQQSPADQQRALEQYAWVEFVHPAATLPSRLSLASAGFFYTDTQVRFRLDLTRIQPGSCAEALAVESADRSAFTIRDGELRPFPYERFYALPGATEPKVSQRYVLWSNNLVRQHPATALRFLQEGKVQGWFLSHPEKGALGLTLAMLSADSNTSGFDLYSRAASEYARRGFRLGTASFSIQNSPVHNIYSALGARFTEPRECWMWIHP